MLLLQKLTALDWLELAFDGEMDMTKIARDWFRGVHIHMSEEKVQESFLGGEPISVFRWSEDDKNVFQAAFYTMESSEVSYVTMTTDAATMFKQVMGVHFCRFNMKKEEKNRGRVEVIKIRKKDLKRACDYGIMLPLKLNEGAFQLQYTVVYWDWDVLRCDGSMKGFPAVDDNVFSADYLSYLDSSRSNVR